MNTNSRTWLLYTHKVTYRTHAYIRATGAALQLSRRLFPRLATRADA